MVYRKFHRILWRRRYNEWKGIYCLKHAWIISPVVWWLHKRNFNTFLFDLNMRQCNISLFHILDYLKWKMFIMPTIAEGNWDKEIKARLVRLLKEGQADTDLVSPALNVLRQPSPPPPLFLISCKWQAMTLYKCAIKVRCYYNLS